MEERCFGRNNIVRLIAEPKIDGLSFSARYVEGIYTLGATRGDGQIGEATTENLAAVQNWPRKLVGNFPRIFEPRGEVYLTRANFKLLNEHQLANGLPPFSNARNAAAGSLRQLNPEITRSRNLDYLVHGWGEISDDFKMPEYYFDFKTTVASWGLQIVPSYVNNDIFDHNLNQYIGT